MFGWLIDLLTTIITWVLSLFGVEYGKAIESSSMTPEAPSVIPSVLDAVPLEQEASVTLS
jgi:hypothetical protein